MALAHQPQPEDAIRYEDDKLIALLAEIAEIADLSLSATKIRLYRAIERLRKLATTRYGDELFEKE